MNRNGLVCRPARGYGRTPYLFQQAAQRIARKQQGLERTSPMAPCLALKQCPHLDHDLEVVCQQICLRRFLRRRHRLQQLSPSPTGLLSSAPSCSCPRHGASQPWCHRLARCCQTFPGRPSQPAQRPIRDQRRRLCPSHPCLRLRPVQSRLNPMHGAWHCRFRFARAVAPQRQLLERRQP